MAVAEEKIYRPINGEDAIDLILNAFRDQMVNSGMFPLHRTWHEFEFVGGVRVKGWSTTTEEVKFKVGEPITETGPPEATELIESRVNVRSLPAPPSLLRETLPDIPCPNEGCGKIFHSKESLRGHINRWCKPKESPLTNDTPAGVEAMAEAMADTAR